MFFLSPALLYGLSAVLVPVILHLMRRRQVVTIPFGTLRFLKKAAQRTRRSARLENLLLLLLRCLVIALIMLAAARPVLKRARFFLFGGEAPRTVVLVLDHSLSMGCTAGDKSRLQLAKEQAKAIVASLKSADSVALLAASDRVRAVIGEPTVDHEAVRSAIDALELSYARTDFAPALREARRIAAKAPDGLRQVFLLTDSQEGGWRFDKKAVFDSAWNETGLRLIEVRPDDRTARNAAVGAVSVRTPFVAAGSKVSGVATIVNHSAAQLADLLEVRLEDAKVFEREVDVAANEAQSVKFEFTVDAAGGRFAHGVVRKSGDALPGDDQAFFLLSVYQAPKILCVDGSDASVPPKLRSSYFLQKALGVGTGSGGGSGSVISPVELEAASLDGIAAVFLADVSALGDRALVRLDRYLQAGGTVVLLPGDRVAAADFSRWEFLPAEPGRVVDLPPGRLRMSLLEPEHDYFSGTWSPRAPFPALPQKRLLDWKPRSDSRVLMTAGEGGGIPFVVERKLGLGRAVIINASPDRTWGDFPLSPAFLPLVQQIGGRAALAATQAQTLLVGDPVPAPPSGSVGDGHWTIKFPDGSSRDVVPDEKGLLLPHADMPGYHEIAARGGEVSRAFVVNPDIRESDLAPIPPEALEELVPHQSVSGLENLLIWLQQREGLVPLWPAMLVLALLAYLAEAVYANRLARRRLTGANIKIRTGRLFRRLPGGPVRLESAAARKAQPNLAEV